MRKFTTGVLAAVAALVVSPTAAHADSSEPFTYCIGSCSTLGTYGTITWHNRTATVSGTVVDTGPGWTQAVFKAYVGTWNQIGRTETRTADDGSPLGSPRGFEFPMGDTNLSGGINRITVQVCFQTYCEDEKEYWR